MGRRECQFICLLLLLIRFSLVDSFIEPTSPSRRRAAEVGRFRIKKLLNINDQSRSSKVETVLKFLSSTFLNLSRSEDELATLYKYQSERWLIVWNKHLSSHSTETFTEGHWTKAVLSNRSALIYRWQREPSCLVNYLSLWQFAAEKILSNHCLLSDRSPVEWC